MKRLVALAFLLIAISSCATFSREECEAMNWRERGEVAAMEGKTFGDMSSYYDKECREEHSVAPDLNSAKAGYESGLQRFCTPEFSEVFALQGGRYVGTCPKDAEDKFLKGYSKARISTLEGEVTKLKSRVSDLEGQLSSAESRANSCQSITPCPVCQ